VEEGPQDDLVFAVALGYWGARKGVFRAGEGYGLRAKPKRELDRPEPGELNHASLSQRGERARTRECEGESQLLLAAGTIRRLRMPIAKPVRTPAPLMNMSRISNSLPGTSC
jgi:hypothetical protein